MYLLYVQDEDTDIIFTAVSPSVGRLFMEAERLFMGWEMGVKWEGFAIAGEHSWFTDQADCDWFIEKVEVV